MKKMLCILALITLVLSLVSCSLLDNLLPGDPPHEHSFVEGKCECGESDPNYQPPHEHKFVEGKCECGESDPNYQPPHEHKFVEGKCECGESDPNYQPPHEHKFVEGKCECGESDPNYQPPHEHSYDGGVITTEPTCTEKGVKTFTCSCGDSYTEDVDMIDHSYGEGVITTEPTCTAKGVKTFTCSCGDSYTEDVDMIDHSFVDGKCQCGAEDPDYIPPTPKIYLAGDSTVKTYEDGQYIAGWGQFLSLFLSDEIEVINAAHGGRSSRSFINEGRLFDIEGSSYTFSQNGGNSIADGIRSGDYLLIQFGHNDDDTKASNYSTMYDRMVPLGEPDENGIYPVIPAEKISTDILPDAYTSKATDSEEATALKEIAKYGDEYYAYGSGTYKWYLKQYIEFARSVGAIPVLVTPVARVKFSGSEIVGGEGLHGVNFAYVEAVRQLAEEEDCLLIDLFADSKTILETATSTYANYLMALKPNELTGAWPSGYDAAYGNVKAGYTGIEATHYNKYGAFLQAAKVAEHLLALGEEISFADDILTTPEKYIDPSNLMSKSAVASVEALFTTVNVTNPDRTYASPDEVAALISALEAKGDVTQENYLAIGEECEAIRAAYYALNVDDRPLVTNLATLEEYEAAVEALIAANKPEPTRVVIFNADNLSLETYTSTVVEGDFTLVATSDKKMDKKSSKVNITIGDETYSLAYGLSVGGKATFGSNRYVSFEVDGPCTVTVAVRSSGSDTRTLTMVDASKNTVGSFEAPGAVAVSSVEIDAAGTYSVGSAGSGMYIYMIIIEYFD